MAGSPGGREVGRLSVKVLPDTSQFGAKLQAFLDRIESRAKVSVKVVPDTRQFTADLRTELAHVRAELAVDVTPDVRQFKAKLRAALARLRVTAKVPVEPDTRGFSAKLTRNLAAIRERVKVQADPDLDGFRAELRQRLSRIHAELKVKIRPDLRAFRAEVTAVVRGLRFRPVDVLVRPTLDMRAYAAVRARLRAIGRPITIRVRTTGSRIPGGGGSGVDGSGGGRTGGASSMARIILAVASMTPQLSALTSSLIQTGPALAVAATGLLAVLSAGGALLIGLRGLGDALHGDAAALAKLTPSAREFVNALKALGPAWKRLRLDVQERLFKGLGDTLTRAAKTVLPVLQTQLGKSASALNLMGKSVLTTAGSLSKSGALGTALDGANKGLTNLSRLPAVIVQGLVQIGAAAGPAFDRMTARAGAALDRLSERMTKSLADGSMQRAIEGAIDIVKQFVAVGKNVGAIWHNIFGTAASASGDFLSTLERVTGELAKVTATPEVQGALFEFFKTLATVSSTTAGILGDALRTIAPAIQELGPPVQRFIELIGKSLKPVFKALQPVLKEAGKAIGKLLDAISPLLPVIGELVAALLPAVTPLLAALGDVFDGLKPVIEEVAGILRDVLKPIFEELAPVIEPLARTIAEQLVFGLGILKDLLVELKPSLVELGEAFGKLLESCGPLLDAWSELSMTILTALMPAVKPVVKLIGKLAALLSNDLADAITNVAVPAIESLSALLSGDVDTAATKAKQALAGFVSGAIRRFSELPSKIAPLMVKFGAYLGAKATEAGQKLIDAIRKKRDEAVRKVAELPSKARSALGNLGGVLVSAGASLISGFVAGIASKIDAVRSKLQGLTSKLPQWKGPKKRDAKILTPAGRLLIEGFIKGIDESTAKLKSRLQSITKALPSYVKSGYGRTLKKATNELEKLVKKRDGVIKKLAVAEKKLADLTKARAAVKTSVVDGILGDADLTKLIDGASSIQGLTQKLKDYAAQATKFASDIAKLRKRGLDADIIRQIADAGVTGGGETAALLASASAAQIKELNKAQAALEKAAGKAGNTAADALYQAGIQSAKGLVKGLESEQAAIEKQMVNIAKSMQKAIKKALGIHSPARKMIPVGRFTTLGVLKGVEDERPALDRVMASLVAVPAVGSTGITAATASSLAGPGLDGARMALVLADGTQLDAYVDSRTDQALTTVRRRHRAGKK